jgi:hypothetical protein
VRESVAAADRNHARTTSHERTANAHRSMSRWCTVG